MDAEHLHNGECSLRLCGPPVNIRTLYGVCTPYGVRRTERRMADEERDSHQQSLETRCLHTAVGPRPGCVAEQPTLALASGVCALTSLTGLRTL